MRVTRSLDVRSSLTKVSATANVEEVCDDLRRWLRQFTTGAGRTSGHPGL